VQEQDEEAEESLQKEKEIWVPKGKGEARKEGKAGHGA
jgi:hypothetical protein